MFRKFVICAGGAAVAVGCLVSFEDYPVAPAAGGSSAGSTGDGSWPAGGSSGLGGSSGNGGSAGSAASGAGGGTGGAGGTVADASGGSAGTPADASTDQPASLCMGMGFWTDPVKPTSPSFSLYFEHDQPLACIEFVVTCGGSEATVAGFDAGACASKQYCWATAVTNCPSGTATVQFIHEKDLNGQGDCHAFFPGSPGSPVAACQFEVSPP